MSEAQRIETSPIVSLTATIPPPGDVWLSPGETIVVHEAPPYPNPSGIIPTEFMVLFLPDPVETKTAGGIVLPDEFKDREQARGVFGTLIAASPLAFNFDDWPKGARKPAAGDRVVVSRHAGLSVKGKDGETYRLLKDKEVLALLDGV